jgi:hypothetical protein
VNALGDWGLTFDVATSMDQLGGDDVALEVETCEDVLELLVEGRIGGMDRLAGVVRPSV